MNELAKHIEVLLLENDCVIVPELGGFIAHYRAASYDEEKGEFCPPMRTIGFNPQLTMNDGLLVQSYMRAYSTDFPDATRKIEKAVQALKEALYKEGEISMGNVGTLYYNINGTYQFEPAEEAFFTPSLYGLHRFSLPKLDEKKSEDKRLHSTDFTPRRHTMQQAWIRNAAAIAAAVLLFFLFSTQVENTYMDEADYASLGTEGLFSMIKDQSMLSNSFATESGKVKTETTAPKGKQSVTTKAKPTVKPVAVRVEKVPSKKTDATTGATPVTPAKKEKSQTKPEKKENAPKKDKETKKGKRFHIIVASLNTEGDARAEAERLQKKGYTDAQVVTADNRFRISIGCFDSQSEAYKRTNEVHKTPGMEAAWVYTQK